MTKWWQNKKKQIELRDTLKAFMKEVDDADLMRVSQHCQESWTDNRRILAICYMPKEMEPK